jgi:hypothetical protein
MQNFIILGVGAQNGLVDDDDDDVPLFPAFNFVWHLQYKLVG